MTENFETEAEREERMAALSGLSVVEIEPEDTEEEPHVPCGCGWNLCGECMRY